MRLRPRSAAGFLFTAGGALLRPGTRRREILRLFARTAAAFGRPLPPPRLRGARCLLADYARFTREQAEAALAGGEDLGALKRRLYKAALSLGRDYRLRLRVGAFGEAAAAARLIYRGLGIDLRIAPDGEVTVRRCAFASVYSPRTCALISELDRGLLAGLSGGGELEFRQRLTEGAPACRAHLTGARI